VKLTLKANAQHQQQRKIPRVLSAFAQGYVTRLSEKKFQLILIIKTGTPKTEKSRRQLKLNTMAHYLTSFSYNSETWSKFTRNPEDRREAATKYIESVGGKLHGFWYAFGSFDGYTLWEAPDNVSMAAVAIALNGGGALSKLETTPLLSVEETLEALRLAQKVGYRAPGTK